MTYSRCRWCEGKLQRLAPFWGLCPICWADKKKGVLPIRKAPTLLSTIKELIFYLDDGVLEGGRRRGRWTCGFTEL